MAPVHRQVRERLDLFEDLFLNIMIGLVIALLVTSYFMPWIVAPVPIVEPPELQGLESRSRGRSNGNASFRQIHTLRLELFRHSDTEPCDDGHRFGALGTTENLDGELCGATYVVRTTNPRWPHRALFWLLILFCGKYIHEASVLRFRLQEASRNEWRTHGFAELLLFGSRMGLLFALYAIVILSFVQHSGWFGETSVALGFIALTAYLIPDLVLHWQLGLKFEDAFSLQRLFRRSKDLSDVVRNWLLLDLFNLLLGLVLVISSFNWLERLEGILTHYVTLIVFILAGSSLYILARAKRFQQLIGKLGIVVVVVAVVVLIFRSLPLPNEDLPAFVGVVLVSLNLADWFFWNPRFFFGEFHQSQHSLQAPEANGGNVTPGS